jgi:hypothetical protein
MHPQEWRASARGLFSRSKDDTRSLILRERGTFTGEYLRNPPNRKVVTIQGIAIHRIAGGKLVEHWGVADKLSFLQQMDAIPPLA